MNRVNLFLFLILAGSSIRSIGQIFNSDPARSYININTPRSAESAGFEKYGDTRVSEFTGTTNVTIPVYTLKSRFLEVPVTLAYQATGIRVNQEASWVGLGWDLNAGGRITVEVKGCADFNGATRGLTSTNLQTGMGQIFNRLGNHGENSVLTPATFWNPPPATPIDPNLYNGFAISEMAQYGTGEPDIFRANFLGHSLTYYIDKITNTIKFLGEQSFFDISYTTDANNNITAWTIIDDDGLTYNFNQAEVTSYTLPGNAVIPASTTTAWLLTRVLHPGGDSVQFTYNNYGYTVPAFTMSGYIDVNASGGGTSVSNDQNQNISMQSPYYLTRIESSNAAIDFLLDTRSDLYGPGSRRLKQIRVSDRISNTVKKTVTFNYSYFQATPYQPIRNYLNSLFYFLPAPLTASAYLATSNSRLRLDSVNVVENTMQPPYRFYYNSIVPDKYSYGQDHWGYFNGVSNETNGYSFSHLVPFDVVQYSLPPAGLGFNVATIGNSRECSPGHSQAMILDSIVYPTGGSTKFFYEPHQSSMITGGSISGGGLRVKLIRNHADGNFAGSKEYAYASGKYMGTINYFTTASMLSHCTSDPVGEVGYFRYSSDGAVNFNDILIGYGQITITEKDASGQTNGSLIKIFNTNTSSGSSGIGFDLQPPYFPPGEPITDLFGHTYLLWLDAAHKNLPPTPSANLEGKLIQEQYFDNSNTLLKSINHYYRLANYKNDYYTIKAIQNRVGGFAGGCIDLSNGYGSGGLRAVNLFVSPAKSFRCLEDSVVEFTYNGSNVLKRKTAYQYNEYYQPMFESLYNSDGTQTITYTRTSAEIKRPVTGAASGFIANQMLQMLNQHIRNLPIEQTVIRRGINGDSSVINSRFNVYQNSLPLQAYIMESQQPLALRSQFVPWYYQTTPSSYSVITDSHYKLYSNADYSPNNMIWTLHTLEGDKAYIWDESYHSLLAQCTNADSSNVAFTSFETQARGRWTYNGSGVVPDNTAPTGNSIYNLTAGSISRSSLSSSMNYIVSYWTKAGGNYSVTGSTSINPGKTINGWTYYEHTVTGVTSVSISGSGSIDEVRLYPSMAQMVSYTYSPFIGITSQCGPDSRVTYYFYDSIGRLAYIKDQDKNVVKTFQYHFKGLPGIQY
jgi:hypothetical protein